MFVSLVVGGTLKRVINADNRFVVVVDDFHMGTKCSQDDAQPFSVDFGRSNAIKTRTISRCEVKTDRFGHECMIAIRVFITHGWSGSRQVIFHLGDAGWITTNAGD